MNGTTIPDGNIHWLAVKDSSDGRRWAVEQRSVLFIAHLVAERRRERWEAPEQPVQLLIHSTGAADEEEAWNWLCQEAEKDALLWQPCRCCGKVTHANKGPVPGYCSRSCEQLDTENIP